MRSAFLEGFFVTFGMITSIGMQNMHVLRVGLQGRYVWPTVVVCIMVDIVIFLLGVLGISKIISSNQDLVVVVLFIGTGFMVLLGIKSFYSFFRSLPKPPLMEMDLSSRQFKSLKQALIAVISISLVNVQMYIEGILLIGSLGGRYPQSDIQFIFIGGSVMASSIWYISLGFFSQRLSPLFKRQITWQILDVFTGSMMFVLAYLMYLDFLRPFLLFS